ERTTVIEAKDVFQAFGAEGDPQRVVALEDTSITVGRGELLCLIGPSGCGKSTLLNVIGGLMRQTSGVVTVEGEPVTGPRPQKVAYVFQESTLFPWKTVLDNIKVG